MAPRREILDSDDEDSDFSPAKEPITATRPNEGNDHGNDISETPRARRAESTDPSIFRDVYDDQRVAGDARQSTSSVAALGSSELVSTLSPNPPPGLSHLDYQPDPAHLSSITDPVLASRRPKRSVMREVVDDLTQVTTPGRPTPGVPTDIWDFPASPEGVTAAAGSSTAQTARTTKKITIKLKKAETKRKITLTPSMQSPEGQPSSGLLPVLSVTQDGGRFDEPMQKRRRISSTGKQAPNSQDVEFVVIPKSEDNVAAAHDHVTPTENSSSIVSGSLKPRSTSLLVIPSTTMTPSQKNEYRLISLSSEADRGHEHLDLPPIGQVDELHRSSGSATIKYPTPTEYASSGRREPHPGEYGTAASNRPKRKRRAVLSDRSSPDIISAHTVTPRARPKRSDWDPAEDDSLVAMTSTQSGRSRNGGKSTALAEPLRSIDSEVAKADREACDRTVDDYLLYLQADVEDKSPTSRPREPPQKKTRGRIRKEVLSAAVTDEVQPTTASGHGEEGHGLGGEEMTELPAEPASKKRRGRPRKEIQKQAIVIEDDSDQAAFQPEHEVVSVPVDEGDETTKPKRKRGRPKKANADTARTVEKATTYGNGGGIHDNEERHLDTADVMRGDTAENDYVKASEEDDRSLVLTERDSNWTVGEPPTKLAAPARDAVEDTAKENQLSDGQLKKDMAKETKPVVPSSQIGKVQYRVGLSRKTRIAPLLSSFRR